MNAKGRQSAVPSSVNNRASPSSWNHPLVGRLLAAWLLHGCRRLFGRQRRDTGQQRGRWLLERVELPRHAGCFLTRLRGGLRGLIALGLRCRQAFCHTLHLNNSGLSLLLVRFALGIGLGLDGRQLGPCLLKLGNRGLVCLLLLGQGCPHLVGVLVRPVQLRAQLAGAALDLLGTGLGGVGLLLGGGQLVAQIVGLDACGLLGRLEGRQAGLQFLDLGGPAVGKLGGLGPVGFQVGAGLV